ncbi:alpha/beta hydrolase [Undibacterium terreum]|uniref:Esterase n=1 Tax=Undibacterium terreum TaxID=1224302 RepID=A0A916XNH1_9BURK|nr:alpha/beta hydrolase [Undibacterium terreum]GGC86665.1 esterase [Undibacterium terreum]
MATWIKLALLLVSALIVAGGIIACAPVKAINALTPSSSYIKAADISYGPDARNKLDIYTPAHLQGKAPVVVFIYGGTWNSGDRADYLFVGEALASRGIVAVLADYRLYPQVRYPSFVEDSAQAVAWTIAHIDAYGGDAAHLFVMGHSAGAYNAAMLALDARWLKAAGSSPAALRGWMGLAGPYDFLPIQNKDAQPAFFYPDTPPDSQPINHVSASAPPTLLIASLNDKLVNPVRNTDGLAARLRAAGVPVTVLHFDKTSHVSLIASMAWPLRGLAPTLDSVVQFVASDGGRLPLKGQAQP